jgi:LPXTG-motif cell wall-anchored protein
MSAYREIGYGAMFFVCAFIGAFLGLTGSGSPLIAVVGAIIGGGCWLAYKYKNLTPKT